MTSSVPPEGSGVPPESSNTKKALAVLGIPVLGVAGLLTVTLLRSPAQLNDPRGFLVYGDSVHYVARCDKYRHCYRPFSKWSWLEERWSWSTEPRKARVGDDVRLQVWAVFLDHDRIEHDESLRIRPHYFGPAESLDVSVAGSFEWRTQSKQYAMSQEDGKFEWTWIGSAEKPGRKLIQLQLPLRSATSVRRHARIGDSTWVMDDSRFVPIWIDVTESRTRENIKLVGASLGWLLGPALTAPWLASILRRRKPGRLPPRLPGPKRVARRRKKRDL